MVSDWKKFRYRLEWLALKILARFVPLLPRMGCVHLGTWLGRLLFQLDRKGRAVSLANIECAFGDRFTPEERVRIARDSYSNFARTMLDLFWAPRLDKRNADHYFEMEGIEPASAVLANGRGFVAFTSHHGNFEWGSLGFGFSKLRGSIVTETFTNTLIQDIFDNLRQRSGQKMIPQASSLLRMLKCVKRGEAVGLLIDLNVPPSQAALAINAFGMKMCVTGIHALIAQRTGCPLIPFSTDPRPDGTCRVTMHPEVDVPPDATVLEITQRCWDVIEEVVTRDPSRWMWSYKHWRYRPRGSTAKYPFYANTSGKFEQVLRRQA
jgi:Kdo2-lipid IVA lauroyltransferase/acyltransferase